MREQDATYSLAAGKVAQMPIASTAQRSDGVEAKVVTTAVVRAAGRLGLSQLELANTIGVSEAIAEGLLTGVYTLARDAKEYELSLLLARLYRSLDSIVGGDDRVAQQWMRNENTALHAKPFELVQNTSGLTDVIAYLDSRRAPI